jgi:filamentous hemagglutinin
MFLRISGAVSAASGWGESAGGVPLCDSSSGRGGFWLVEGAVAQHGEQHVAASSSESDERLIVALALLDLARVIVP